MPSELDAIDFQAPTPGPDRTVQVVPESEEVQILPPLVVAASFVPSELDAIEFHAALEDEVAVQVEPLSEETEIFPFRAVAASFVPSSLDATADQLVLELVCCVQVTPEFVEVRMLPVFPPPTATSFVPPPLEAMAA